MLVKYKLFCSVVNIVFFSALLPDEASLQHAPELGGWGGGGGSGGWEPLPEVSAGGGKERSHPPDQREGRADPAAGGERPGEGGAEEGQEWPGGAEEAAGQSPGED